MNRSFKIVWAGQLLSLAGSAIASFGAAIWVFNETASYLWLGALFAITAAADLLAAPFASLVDRFDRRVVMLVADASAATVTLALLGLWTMDALQPLQLAIGGGLVAFASSFQEMAYAAAVPDLVESDSLAKANGLLQLGPAIAIVAGPAGASALFALGGVGAILAVDLATFGIGLLSVLVAKFVSLSARDEGDDGSLRAALSWLRTTGRPLLGLIAVGATANLVLGAYSVVALGRAANLGGAGRAGWPLAMGGAAMIITSIVVASNGLPTRRVRVVAAGAAWFGIFTVIAGARPSLLLLVIGMGAAFAAVPLIQAAVSTIFHERAPEAMRGRIFGISSGAGLALAPIGSVSGGVAASWSESGSLAVIGLVLLGVGLAVALSRSLASIDLGS